MCQTKGLDGVHVEVFKIFINSASHSLIAHALQKSGIFHQQVNIKHAAVILAAACYHLLNTENIIHPAAA
jgi:hypothetical protein